MHWPKGLGKGGVGILLPFLQGERGGGAARRSDYSRAVRAGRNPEQRLPPHPLDWSHMDWNSERNKCGTACLGIQPRDREGPEKRQSSANRTLASTPRARYSASRKAIGSSVSTIWNFITTFRNARTNWGRAQDFIFKSCSPFYGPLHSLNWLWLTELILVL